MPTQEVNCNMAWAVTSANCARAINTARRDRFEAAERAGSKPVWFLVLFFFLASIAARNLEHWGKFSAFRATTSIRELFSVYLNLAELSLIFCHLVYLTQTIRSGWVFLAKPPESPPLQQDGNSVVYVHTVHGGQLVPRASRAPRGV